MALIDIEALRTAIAFCVGEDITIRFEAEEQEALATVPFVFQPAGACTVHVTMGTLVQIGEDDVRRTWDPVDEVLDVLHAGNRLVTVSVRVESDQRELSLETAERIRTRIRFMSPRQTLLDAGISIAWVDQIQRMDLNWDNRQVSCAVIDMRLNVASNDQDSSLTPIDEVNDDNIIPWP